MKLVKSEAPVTTTHKKFGELSVIVEYPEAESLQDAVNMHGGEDNLLRFINSSHETSARNVARPYLRGLPEETTDLEQAYGKARSLAANWSPRSETGEARSTNKAKAARLDELKAMVTSGKTLSHKELLEFLGS